MKTTEKGSKDEMVTLLGNSTRLIADQVIDTGEHVFQTVENGTLNVLYKTKRYFYLFAFLDGNMSFACNSEVYTAMVFFFFA